MSDSSRRGAVLTLAATSALLAGGLLWMSQTFSFSWDEGFHLLAAQLIAHGRRPYVDFCFAQSPLNAYWNAAWMKLVGESWRVAHALAALETAGAVFLAAEFLISRWSGPRWRISAALTAAVLFGLNPQVVRYGEVGQAYGLCLLLSVAAFRVAVEAAERERIGWAAGAGFLAAASAGSSLLTAPVGPIIVVWMLLANRTGNRWTKFLAAAGGAIIAWTPVWWLFVQAPRATFFDLFRYHLFYRRSEWEGATQHDLAVFRACLTSPPAILLAFLAAAGLWFVVKEKDRFSERRAEFYLCATLAVVLTLFISTAHPTFERYYLLPTPFFAMLGAIGLWGIASRTGAGEQPWWPVITASVVMAATLIYQLEGWREELHWSDFVPIAHKVDEVSAPGAALYADEQVYFLTRRTPPSGMEYESSHKLRLLPDQAREVHIVPQPEWDRHIAAGEFATLETCDGEDWIKERSLPKLYANRAEVGDCTVFWKVAPHE